MADVNKELAITIRARERARAEIKKVRREIQNFKRRVVGQFRAIKRAATSTRGAIAGLGLAIGGAAIAKSFIDTASSVENMQLTLKALLGDIGEANKLFDDLATFAGRVPFELREIMQVGTAFAGTFKGGREEIMKIMPLVGDLAAVAKAQGISFQETGEQLQRMFAAGAASADRFREKGILAMLGFQQGVSYSAEETKRMVIEAWEKTGSKFKGAAADMAQTWTGKVSMMQDAWFRFQKDVMMKGGVFDYLKLGLDEVITEMGGLEKAAPQVGDAILDGMEFVVKAIAGIADGYRLAKLAAMEFAKGALEARHKWVTGEEVGWIKKINEGVRGMVPGLQTVVETWRDIKKSILGAKELTQDQKQTLWAIADLKQKIEKTKVDKTAVEVATAALAKIRQQHEIKKEMAILDDVLAKHKADVAAATALEEETLARIQAHYDGIVKGPLKEQLSLLEDSAAETRALEEAWKKLFGPVEDIQIQVKTLADEIGEIRAAEEAWFSTSKIRSHSAEVARIQELYQGVAGVLHSSVLSALDQVYEKGFKIRKFLQDLMQDLSKAGVSMAFQWGTAALGSAVFGAKGGVFNTGGNRGIPINRYQYGGIAYGPEVVIRGEAGVPEAHVPLKDGKNIPVKIEGGGGGRPMEFHFHGTPDTINARAMLYQSRDAIREIIRLELEENPRGLTMGMP
jgi:hypothetical protein